jgi:hypothetical protein
MNKKHKDLLNKSLQTLFILSTSCFLFSVLLIFNHVPHGAAFSAQAGILGVVGWSFVKELFYYY